MIDPDSLTPFVDPLPIPEVLRSTGDRADPDDAHLRIPCYRVTMRQTTRRLHRDLPPTRLWTYGSSLPGPTIETRSGRGVLVEWVNALPTRHLFPIDHKLHGAEADKPAVRAVVHVHGAKAPPHSDGYPADWYVSGKSALYHYPNRQDAATLWYHDHAMGINRLNIYAGLIGVFVVRDDVEDRLGLPAGACDIPLVLCDRLLTPQGQLAYPVSPNPQSPWIPDLFGNIILVNGAVLPHLDVQPRRYRFRVLNASNARLYHLSLSNGLGFQQIGTDQGLLPAPVPLTDLVLAPAERADLVLDFSHSAGERIVLRNEAVNVMQFRVARGKVDDRSSVPASLRPVERLDESAAVQTRTLTLNEYTDRSGETVLMLLNATYWHMPITENPVLSTVEVWNLVNLTDDVHPIHLHLVRFQVLDRRAFDRFAYETAKTLRFTRAAVPPAANESGWKDTVRAEPGMVTRIIVRFEGYTGRYVWHCHNLEHEDNEMMRPYEVLPAT